MEPLFPFRPARSIEELEGEGQTAIFVIDMMEAPSPRLGDLEGQVCTMTHGTHHGTHHDSPDTPCHTMRHTMTPVVNQCFKRLPN